jgi:hypothetical protein
MPFRDCSVVLTVFSVGKVLSQLYDHLIEDKPGLLPIQYDELLPRKGKRRIDYFVVTALEDGPDMADLASVLADLKAPLDVMVPNVLT